VQNKFCVTEFRTENSGYRQNKEETGRKELLEVGLLDMVTMEAMPWSVCLLHANEVKKTQVHLLSNAFAFQVKRKYVSGKTSKRFHTNVKAFFAPDELP